MALTILEAAKQNPGDVVRNAVVEMFARTSGILEALPVKSIPGGSYRYAQQAALPGIAFRGVNGSYTESTGVLNPLTESLAIIGGDLDVDKFILQTQGMEVRATHEQMKVTALAQEYTRAFLKGDSSAPSTAPEFDGLQNRLTGNQKISNGTTSGGDPLSLANLDQAIDSVDSPTHIIMSKAMRRRLTTASRNTSVGGFITWEVDSFGRKLAMYGGLPIVVPYPENGGTEPIAFDEAAASGGTTATSIYVVSFGDGRLSGIQNGTMDVRDLGELPTAPVFRTRVEWYTGIVLEHGRAAARLYGISNAAVTA